MQGMMACIGAARYPHWGGGMCASSCNSRDVLDADCDVMWCEPVNFLESLSLALHRRHLCRLQDALPGMYEFRPSPFPYVLPAPNIVPIFAFITCSILMFCWELFLPWESKFLTGRKSDLFAQHSAWEIVNSIHAYRMPTYLVSVSSSMH